MDGLFITFEGTEGCGKSTQVELLAGRLRGLGRVVRLLREPGGTPIGEEIRHTLKHSKDNSAMTWEAELLLMNASRAQLVRELIRPALSRGEIVVCDRFFDSTTAYQGFGRMLDLDAVQGIIEFAVGGTLPDLTLLVTVPPEVSTERLRSRQANLPFVRDRIEEADRAFFDRVSRGYEQIAAHDPQRIKKIDGARGVRDVQDAVWAEVEQVRNRNR